MGDGDAFTVKGAEVRVKEVPESPSANLVSRMTSTHVYAYTRSFAYICDILFSRVHCYEGGVCTALVLHLSSFSPFSSSAFAFTLLCLRIRSSTSGRYCVTMHTTGQTPTVLRATDSGANVIIFRNLLSRCSPLWSRCRCLGFIFPARFRQSPTLRYFAFVRGTNFFARESVQSWNLHICVQTQRWKKKKEK